MDNNAEDPAAAFDASGLLGECEQMKSKIEVKKPDFPTYKSDVPLEAAPGKGAGTTAATETLENVAALEEVEDEYRPRTKKLKNNLEEVEEDLEEVEEDMEEVEEDMKEVEEDLDDTDRQTVEALKILAVAKAELYHPKGKRLLDAIDQQGGGKASAKLKPTHAAASRIQQMTESTLTKRDVKEASRRLQNKPSETDGELGFFKYGTEMIENKRGNKVLKNPSIVAVERWKVLKEEGRGLPDITAGKSHNLTEMIPKYSELLPHILGCGVDYFRIAGEPKSWDFE